MLTRKLALRKFKVKKTLSYKIIDNCECMSEIQFITIQVDIVKT